MKNGPTKIRMCELYCHISKFPHGIFLSIQHFVPTSCSKAVFFLWVVFFFPCQIIIFNCFELFFKKVTLSIK